MLGREVHAHPARFSAVMPLQLRRTPLLYAAAVFALGVAISQWWRPAALLVSGRALFWCLPQSRCAGHSVSPQPPRC